MTTIAIHHVGTNGGSIPMHAGIAAHIQGRGAFDLIGFCATGHVRLMSVRDLCEALEAASSQPSLEYFPHGSIFESCCVQTQRSLRLRSFELFIIVWWEGSGS